MTTEKPKTAAKTRLERGENSIDRVTPRQLPDGTWVIDWRVRLHNGKLVRKRTQAPKKGLLLKRAKKISATLLKTSGTRWEIDKPITDYLANDVARRIENAPMLKDLSKRRYLAALEILKVKFDGLSIYDAMGFEEVEKALMEISAEHPGSAHACRTILSKYTAPPLMAAKIIDANHAKSVALSRKRPDKQQQRRTLTKPEWDAVIKHLLTRDTEPLLTPTKHKNIRQSTKNKHARAVRLMLLQAITGLRISEANSVQWKHLTMRDNGRLVIDAQRDIVKGRLGKEKGRLIPILRQDVADYLLQHRGDPEEYIVGSPADTFKPWDSTNADDSVPHLYRQVAEATGVKILADLRSHSWRSTLHAVFSDTIPLSRRAEMFGHTEAVAKDAYHDRANVDALLRDVDDAFIA